MFSRAMAADDFGRCFRIVYGFLNCSYNPERFRTVVRQFRTVEGAIQAVASDVPLTWDEQGRLDAEGLGAIASEDVPYVLLTKYGRRAMYFGPRQPVGGQEVPGQTGGGSEHGAGSGTFDWDLLPSPAGSRAGE